MTSVNFCGIKVKVLKGTVRKKVDKDDVWFFYLSQNATKVFDLGCNIGYMSLMSALQKRNESIVLVDPNPEALGKAAENLILNGFGYKTKFISAFIGDTDGEKLQFYTVGTGEAGSMYASHAETASAVNSHYEVKMLTIDSLVDKVQVIPDLVKIDVEGAEYLALKGATKLAGNQKAKFFIEMHSLKEQPMIKNAELVLNWCKLNTYKAYYLKEGKEIKDPHMIAHRGKCHLLLIPKNEIFPDYLKGVKEASILPNFNL